MTDETVMATAPMPAGQPKTTIGGFEVLQKLGQGAMGSVFKAQQPLLNRTVALKVLAAQLGSDPEFVSRFVREAASAANLMHPNMVQVYTAGEDQGRYFIAMEFVDGESVMARLKRHGTMTPAEAVAITVYVAEALNYAWNKAKLIHRDIKPDNIFLSNSGEVKLGDLGLAKSIADEQPQMTTTGVMMGTPHYMSPEQARAERSIDFRTDIYSLGCSLFHMLTGQIPFSGDSALAVAMKHIEEPVPSITQACPTCPHHLAKVVTRMMAKKPEDRYASYAALLAELNQVYAGLVRDEKCKPALAKTSAHTRQGLYTGLGLTAVLVAGLFVWAPWKKNSSGVEPHASRPASESEVKQPAPAKQGPVVAVVRDNGTEWKNLMPLINPQQGGFNGDWKIVNGELVCEHVQGWGICEIPVDYRGGNYDLRIRVTRGEGASIGMFFPFRKGAGGGNVIFDGALPGMPKNGLKRVTLDNLRGLPTGDSSVPHADRSAWLPQGKLSTVLLQIRDREVVVKLNDEEVLRWDADWTQLKQYDRFGGELFRPYNDRPIFGVGIFNCSATYHAIELHEITDHINEPKGGVDKVHMPPEGGTVAKSRAEDGSLTAEQSVLQVVAKLKELNPGYDGKEEHKIENGQVVALTIPVASMAALKDISPLAVLRDLTTLICAGQLDRFKWSPKVRGGITDLAPLAGLRLRELNCDCNPILDVAPLRGMPLRSLNCTATAIKDIAPLAGMPIEELFMFATEVSDLAPLKGSPLKILAIGHTHVSDLAPLAGSRLTKLFCDATPIADLTPLTGVPLEFLVCGLEVLQSSANLSAVKNIPTLQKINFTPAGQIFRQLEAQGAAPAAAGKGRQETAADQSGQAEQAVQLKTLKADFEKHIITKEAYEKKVRQVLDGI